MTTRSLPLAGNEAASVATGARGFSLLESLVAIAVASIFLSIAAPSLVGALQAFANRGASREVYGHLQRARGLAVSENNPYCVKLVGASPPYTRFAVHDDDDRDGCVEDSGESVVVHDVQASFPHVVLTGPAVIQFRPNGSASPAGVIALRTAAGWSAAVSVGPGGRIRIE